MASYRQSLIEAEQKGQESFDKTVLSLAGGALGISFVFVKDIIGPNPIIDPAYLLTAWVFWASSTLAVLSSFYFSNRALRLAVKQCDAKTIHCEAPGRFYSTLTRTCNVLGIVFLIAGILFMAAFVYQNLLQRGRSNVTETHCTDTSATRVTASAPDSSTDSARKPNTGEGIRAAPATAD